MASGIDPATGEARVAKGIVAIGPTAFGVVAVGIRSVGLLSAGIFSGGVVSVGLLSVGFLTTGLISVGLMATGLLSLAVWQAVGLVAAGSKPIGLETIIISEKTTGLIFGLFIAFSYVSSRLVWAFARKSVPPGSSRREKAQIEKPESEKSFKKSWFVSPFSSPEVREISAHLSKDERGEAVFYGLMWGCWVVMATFGNFWLIKSFPAPGNWIVASVIAGIFFASLPPWFRLQRRFLYSTAWAKAQGYTAGQVKLFSFSRRNLWRVLIFAGAGVVLAYGQFKLVTHLSGVSQLSEDLKGSAARTKEQITRLATQRQSVAPKLAFGPSVFGTIYESQEPDALTFFGSGYSTNANVLACFDSGELFVGSREMWEVHKQGALGTRPEQYNRVQVLNGVVGLETAIRPAENQNWDELTADAVAEQLDPVQTMSVDRFPATMNKLLPSIWMFRTHNGSMGIFQILGLTENPRGVKLRYKLVQNGNTAPVVAAPKLTFGPVDEQLLTRMRAIDFDTDKLATLGLDKNGNFRHDIYYWPVVDMRKQGLDALYEAQTSNSLLTGDLKVIDLLNNDWERIRPEQLKQLFQSLDLATVRPPPAIEFKTNGLTTYGFQTREGGMGILQITCSTDNPRGVKLRYKLVQTEPAATNAAPAQTAAFQIRRVADDSDNSAATETVTNFLDANHVESLRLLPGVLLDGKAVENAGWNTSESRTNLVLGLTEDGSRQFATVTAANLQHRITMLFQGRVLFAPVIQAAIASRSLEIPVNWDMKDLERTMNGLNQMNNPVADLRFGPEQESVLPPLNGNNGNYTFLNLRANRLVTTSISGSESRAFHDWQRASGADLGAAVEEKIPVLVAYGMATAPAIADGLENASPADIWYNWNLMVNEPKARTTLIKPPANGTDTYYFRTRDDTWGMLQITGFSENPHGVKIRYKLVQNGGQENSSHR